MAENIKKILIRGVNWIGDAVLTIPAINSVRRAFPDAHISLLVKPWVAEIFKESPDINEIILYEERFNSFSGKFKLARMLKARGFSTAILLQNAFDAAFITWLAGIPERIGYSRDYRRLLLTRPVTVRKTVDSSQFTFYRQNKHHVYYYLNLIKEALDIEAENIEPSIYLTEEEIHKAKEFLISRFPLPISHFPLIGINPGATYGSAKRWMPERFAELIHRIIDELNGRVVLFGSKSEAGIAQEIIQKIEIEKIRSWEDKSFSASQPLSFLTSPPANSGLRPCILNVTGKTNLRELTALISECDTFITNDSGPMHIASALLVPVVAIFGSTDRTVTGPLGNGHKTVSKDIPCSPCMKRECPVSTTRFREKHLKCMTEITTDDVFNALQEILPNENAVFLDKDGTLIEDVGYLNSFSNLKMFAGVKEALQGLKKAGFKLIGVTNQSGIARGLVSKEFVNASNAYLQETLGIDCFYYCPHHPDNGCQCRKPKPMFLRKARLEHRINLKASYVIGDKTIDMLLAKAVGAKGILVLTGHDKESEHADFIAQNLTEAVDWILKREKA